jgi:hypothetical protein
MVGYKNAVKWRRILGPSKGLLPALVVWPGENIALRNAMSTLQAWESK